MLNIYILFGMRKIMKQREIEIIKSPVVHSSFKNSKELFYLGAII
jgi:hypothetical protein